MILLFALIINVTSGQSTSFEVLNDPLNMSQLYWQGNKQKFICDNVLEIDGYQGNQGNNSFAIQQYQMPQHTRLSLEVILYGMNQSNWLDLYVDKTLAWSYQSSQQIYSKCPQSEFLMIKLNINIVHTGSQGIVIFVGKENERWGFSNLTLSVQKCPIGCLTCEDEDSQIFCSLWQAGLIDWSSFQSNQLSLEGWQLNQGQEKVSNCGYIPLIGGYNNFGSKTLLYKLIDMKPHFKVRIQLLWVKIDSWDNEQGQLLVDGIIVWKQNYTNKDGQGTKICGNPNTQYETVFENIDIIVDHTGDIMQLSVTSTLNQAADDESFGIRDLKIFYIPCANQCEECQGPLIQDCIKCSNNSNIYYQQCESDYNFIILEKNFNFAEIYDEEGWQLHGNQNDNVITECMGLNLLGGYKSLGGGGYITKTFEIPTHNRLRLQVVIYKIDSWDNEKFIIEVDDAEVWTHNWLVDTNYNYCGGSWTDQKVNVDIVFQHSNQEAKIKFYTTLNQESQDESWGIREFTLMYEFQIGVQMISTTDLIVFQILLIFLICL